MKEPGAGVLEVTTSFPSFFLPLLTLKTTSCQAIINYQVIQFILSRFHKLQTELSLEVGMNFPPTLAM